MGGPRGPWSIKKESEWKKRGGGEGGGESYRVNSWPSWTTPPTFSMDMLSAVGCSFRDKQSSVSAAVTLFNQWTETKSGLHYTTVTLFNCLSAGLS